MYCMLPLHLFATLCMTVFSLLPVSVDDKQCRAVVETIFLALKGFVLYLTDGIRCIFWFQSSSLKLFFHVYCFSVDNLSCSNISFVVCLLMSFLQKTFKNVFVSPVIFFIYFFGLVVCLLCNMSLMLCYGRLILSVIIKLIMIIIIIAWSACCCCVSCAIQLNNACFFPARIVIHRSRLYFVCLTSFVSGSERRQRWPLRADVWQQQSRNVCWRPARFTWATWTNRCTWRTWQKGITLLVSVIIVTINIIIVVVDRLVIIIRFNLRPWMRLRKADESVFWTTTLLPHSGTSKTDVTRFTMSWSLLCRDIYTTQHNAQISTYIFVHVIGLVRDIRI